MVVATSDSLQAAVDSCPAGGSILLLPGAHWGALSIRGKEVHVFGRGRAILRPGPLVAGAPAAGVDFHGRISAIVTISSSFASLDGVQVIGGPALPTLSSPRAANCLRVEGAGARPRIQSVYFSAASCHNIVVAGGAAPLLLNCRCVRLHARLQACMQGLHARMHALDIDLISKYSRNYTYRYVRKGS